MVPVQDLRPASYNPRKKLRPGDAEYEKIKGSIEEFGFADPLALLAGVESRTSSPVRLERGADCQSVSHRGLYPCGEGAGYAGGITSAAADGLRVAEAILSESDC